MDAEPNILSICDFYACKLRIQIYKCINNKDQNVALF